MTHTERANELLKQDYHCSQALFGAFAGDLGLDIKTALKLSTCFGVGMRQGGCLWLCDGVFDDTRHGVWI